MKKNALDWIVLIIAVIAGANWLSVALLNYEFVYAMFGNIIEILPRLILILFGLATLYLAYTKCKK
jgi:hypothetical protein